MSMNATWSAPGSSGVERARRARKSLCTRWSWRLCPWVNERRNVPRVEGARTPVKSLPIAPCRSRSTSSMLSAPAHIAATSVIAFAPGLAPPLLPAPSMRSLCATIPGRPVRSARRTSGTSPASATKFDSSKAARTAATAWEDCISRMFSRSVDMEP